MTKDIAYRLGFTQLQINPQFTTKQLLAEYARIIKLYGFHVAESYLRGAYDAGRAVLVL